MLAGVGALMVWAYNSDPDADVLSDATFGDRADAICQRFHEQHGPRATERSTNEERAAVVETTNGLFEEMVADLQALPVAPQDRETVDAWLDIWAEILDVGWRYAEAIRTDHPDVHRIGDEADLPFIRVNRFARSNGMDSCVF